MNDTKSQTASGKVLLHFDEGMHREFNGANPC